MTLPIACLAKAYLVISVLKGWAAGPNDGLYWLFWTLEPTYAKQFQSFAHVYGNFLFVGLIK